MCNIICRFIAKKICYVSWQSKQDVSIKLRNVTYLQKFQIY